MFRHSKKEISASMRRVGWGAKCSSGLSRYRYAPVDASFDLDGASADYGINSIPVHVYYQGGFTKGERTSSLQYIPSRGADFWIFGIFNRRQPAATGG
jgi:hypothetical protein